jgi:DNA-binding NarL/FixJ family response regulator
MPDANRWFQFMENLYTEGEMMQQNGSTATTSRPKLLVADDHHIVLDALAYMAGHEYQVLGVDSLKAFEEAIDSFSPDIASLDIRMPDGDGIEAARRILQKRPDLKLMFLSMHTEPGFVRRAMETGAQAYLSKRAPAEELLLAIRTVLNGGKYIGSRMGASDTEDKLAEGALTDRQREVLRLIAQGCSAKEIANQLGISVRTAEFHRAAIMDRLKLHSTAMMTRYAVDQGIA